MLLIRSFEVYRVLRSARECSVTPMIRIKCSSQNHDLTEIIEIHMLVVFIHMDDTAIAPFLHRTDLPLVHFIKLNAYQSTTSILFH